MRKTLLILLLCLSVVGGKALDACTIIMLSRGNIVLAGNNEDWTFPFTKIWIVPATNDEYGRICFGFAFDLEGRFPTGGMNDQGLFIDGNGLSRDTGWTPVEGKPTFKGIVEDHILAHCTTVEEAIRFFHDHNVPNLKAGRFPIADKTGASVIVEWSRGKTQFLRKQGDYQVSTNFVASNYERDDFPCYRYELADKILNDAEVFSVDTVREALSATRFLSSGSVTLFSNICDLKNGDVYIYNFHNFENAVRINLFEELKKGEKAYYIPRLFPYVPFAQWNMMPSATADLLLGLHDSRGFDTVKESIPELREHCLGAFRHDFTEAILNTLGYDLMNLNRIDDAINIFKLNIVEHPDSSLVYDSLGEAYAKQENIESAIESYKISVELDPTNEHAERQLKRLQNKHVKQ